MSWLDKLMAGHSKRGETAKETALESYKQKLKNIVYDEDLVEELAPVFAKLHGNEGFDKVFELLESKEQQICAISGGEWHTQETDPQKQTHDSDATDEEEETETLSAEEILAKKYESQ